MGLRDKLKSVKRFLQDPQGWTESHGSHMNAEYAKYGTPKDATEVHEQPRPQEPQEPQEPQDD